MKVFAFLFVAGFLSLSNFLCSGRSKYQDFSDDSTGSNYVQQSVRDTLLPSKYNTFCDNIVSVSARQLKDCRNGDDIIFGVRHISLSH